MNAEKIKKIVEKAIENAESDREIAYTFIKRVENEIEENTSEATADSSATGISNLINALQRSNEQIIKSGELVRKFKKEQDDGSFDTSEIYDTIEDRDFDEGETIEEMKVEEESNEKEGDD